jgi:DNA-directed RNA polymerase subunit RPC12/RpoP
MKIQVTCMNCNKPFEKEQKDILVTNGNFCSRSCAATFNNKKFPKRKRTRNYKCPKCGSSISFGSIQCQQCKRAEDIERIQDTPISQHFLNGTSRYKHTRIRAIAKRFMQFWKVPKKCHFCDFDYVLHVAHIKPISSFSKDSLIKEVNSKENLTYLCPNHHALLDHGKIKMG